MTVNEDFFQKIHQYISHYNLLYPSENILIAVSGGQDSIFLLEIIKRLQPYWKWKIGVCYIDHGCKSDSLATGTYLANICNENNLCYYQVASNKYFSNEIEARGWRYEILQYIALKQGYTTILLGHTNQDQIENLFLNLFRQLDYENLSLIKNKFKWETNIFFIRPLLPFKREETLFNNNYLAWEDRTNYQMTWSRNRIRYQLIPYLSKYFNHKIKDLFYNKTLLQKNREEYFESIEHIILKQEFIKYKFIPKKIIFALPLILQTRLLQVWIFKITLLTISIEQVLHILHSNKTNHQIYSLKNNYKLYITKEWVVIDKIE